MEKHFPDVRLVILHSEYRSIIRPISRFIDKIRKKRMIKLFNYSSRSRIYPKKAWTLIAQSNEFTFKIAFNLSKTLLCVLFHSN